MIKTRNFNNIFAPKMHLDNQVEGPSHADSVSLYTQLKRERRIAQAEVERFKKMRLACLGSLKFLAVAITELQGTGDSR